MRSLRLAAALACLLAQETRAQSAFDSALVEVSVDDGGRVRVAQIYAREAPTPMPELRMLARPCAAVENVHIRSAGGDTPLQREADGPWVIHRAPASAREATVEIRFDVTVTGSGMAVPLLLAGGQVARGTDGRGRVAIRVRSRDSSIAVVFPRMSRPAPGEWRERYVAVPAWLEITRAGSTACGEAAARGDDGGLQWRFLLLAGIMVAWVPAYLAWARRADEQVA